MKEVDSDFMDKGRVFPPGFRFHPTDEELVLYYLKRKVCCKRHHLDVIGETDVYKWDPEELPGMSKLKTEDRQWFFFSPRDRRYPNGARSNRATKHGYWKATGKDRTISSGPRNVGLKKTLVFYRGRAPSGERTDWVMHEYTMDEVELKRCQTDKEYFALYKVYKKSGPGPKNGEQYGAPFREDFWDNDELEVQSFMVDDSGDDAVNGQCLSSGDFLTEIMKKIEDEPTMNLPQIDDNNGYALAEEAMTSNLAEHSLQDVSISAVHDYNQRVDVPSSFDFGHIEMNQTPIFNALDVPSVPLLNLQEVNAPEEDFFEDCLEMNDLMAPCSDSLSTYIPHDELHFCEADGFNEFDFHDASLLPFDVGTSESWQLNSGVGTSNTISHFPSTYLENLTSMYPLHQQSSNLNLNGYQPCTEEQGCCISSTEADQEFIHLLNPGNVHENRTVDFVNHPPTRANEIGSQKQDDDDGTDSWLSSTLWSFVESIPTTPASASESVLVNRTLKMSSISRLSLNNTGVSVLLHFPSGKGVAKLSSSTKSTTSFMFIVSFVGVLCATLWISAKFVGCY